MIQHERRWSFTDAAGRKHIAIIALIGSGRGGDWVFESALISESMDEPSLCDHARIGLNVGTSQFKEWPQKDLDGIVIEPGNFDIQNGVALHLCGGSLQEKTYTCRTTNMKPGMIEILARPLDANGANVSVEPFSVWINPGNASVKTISDILVALSNLQMAAGGGGFYFEVKQ